MFGDKFTTQYVNNMMDLSKTTGHLASGKRINSAADDPAGMAISQLMRADVAVARQAGRNLVDGVSLAQTAEGAAGSIQANLAQIKSLGTQYMTDTYSPAHKKIIKDQLHNLIDGIRDTADTASFNGVKLLDGDGKIQISAGDGQMVDVDTKDLSLDCLAGMDIEADPEAYIAAVNQAIENVSAFRGELGAEMNRLETAKDVQDIRAEMTLSAQSRIEDADIARETAKLAGSQITMQSGIAMQAQSNINASMMLQLLQ